MELGEMISVYRRQAGLTIDELAIKSGVPKGTINKIIGGITKAPTLDTVKAIARALNLRLADFDDEPQLAELFTASEQEIIKKYRALDKHGKDVIDSTLNLEYQRIEQAAHPTPAPAPEPERSVVYFSLPFYLQPSSAGLGEWADEGHADEIDLVKRPPWGTSFIVPVNGDSMEPTYPDGCKVFVRSQESVRIGQVGIFFMDGELWIKELGDGELISHNPKYPPRPMTNDIRCQGRVLGICDDSYFEH